MLLLATFVMLGALEGVPGVNCDAIVGMRAEDLVAVVKEALGPGVIAAAGISALEDSDAPTFEEEDSEGAAADEDSERIAADEDSEERAADEDSAALSCRTSNVSLISGYPTKVHAITHVLAIVATGEFSST